MKRFSTLVVLCAMMLFVALGLAQTPDYLVWVHPDVVVGTASEASGDSLFNALVANGQSAALTDSLFEFGTDLSMYQGIFVVLGIFSNNGVLADTSAEALALDTYVTSGGNLYLEGGDCFAYDPQFAGGYDINPWFDCVPLSDGSSDVFNLLGLNELSAFTFAYGGENNWMDQLSSGGVSSEIWQETATQNIHGLYYNGNGGAAIGVVASFGGMISTGAPVSSMMRTFNARTDQQPQPGSYKSVEERVANNKPFVKKYGYKPELATRIDPSKPLYKISPNGGIDFLANNQTDLMAAYLALMNPEPELMYYKFNEAGSTYTVNFAAAGSPVPDTAQVLGLTMGGSGYEGSALIGNGGSSSTNYVNTGWITNLGTGPWTISLWLNNVDASTTLYYHFGDNTATSFRCFSGGVAGAGNLLLRGPVADVLVTGVAPGPSVVDFVYDDVAGEVRAYLNGVLNNTVPQTGVNVVGTANFKVGGYSTSAGLAAGELMDEFKMYNRAIDVAANARDYAVTSFVDLPMFWYVGFNYDVKAIVLNEGANAQTDVPVRLFIDGVQEGSDVLVTLASGDSMEVSFPWTPSTAAMTNIKIQSFLTGDQDTSNDSVTTDVNVASGAPAMTVSPSSVEDSLAAGPTSSDTITVGNVSGAGPLDFEIAIESVTGPNAKVDFIADGQARKAPIISRGKELPVSEYLQRLGASAKTISFESEHPEDQVEPYDQIMPNESAVGVKRISNISFDGSPDGEEVFGSNQNVYGPSGARGRGNHFYCTTATTLTEHRLYLNMTVNSDMQFLVYEGAAQVGNYNLINVTEIASSGTGEGWYSSGTISVPLVAGMYYLIYPQWTQAANYYNEQNISPYPIPTSFGELQMGVGWNWAPAYTVPPTDPQAVPSTAFGAPTAYYQTIVTGAGTSWLSVNPEMGTIPAGQSMDVIVTYDANGILGGDYYANVIVSGNDPANLADTVAAHLYVIAEANVGFNPDPVVFDTTFVNQTSDRSAHVLNTGAGQLSVTNITSSDPAFSVNQTSFTVPPLDSVEITVSFSPTSEGSKTGTLTISSDDPNNPTYDVSVEGEAIRPPQIAVNPSSITDSVAINDSMDVTMEIHNNATTGAAALDWSASVSITKNKRLHIPAASPNFLHGEYAPSMGVAPADGHGIVAPSYPPFNTALSFGSAWSLEQANGFVTYFDLIIPQVLNNLAPDPTGAGFDNAGDFGPGDQSFFYNLDSPGEFMKVDTSTGAGTLLGTILPPGAETWAGMATDPTDGTIYAVSLALNVSSTLNIIDPVNLTRTAVGPTGAPGIISLAIDGNGDMWAHDLVTDNFLSIDKATGASTVVGPLGFDANYGQGMTWDPETDQLFMAAFNNVTFVPELRIVDRSTGGSTLVGVLGQAVPGGLCQLGFLAIPGGGGPTWIVLMGATSGSVDPGDVANLDVRIYGLDVPDTTYTADIEIESNDPANPLVTIPVEIKAVQGTGIDEESTLPSTFAISQNYPNPFNPTTTFNYQLPEISDVKLIIYNVLGQKVRTLINQSVEPGYHTVEWNGLNDSGTQVATGLYIYRFQAGDFTKTIKMMMLK